MEKPSPTDNEPAWSRYLADRWGGEAEARLVDGSRCDVLTTTEACEIEWAKKWKESVGQAALYGVLTGRTPVVCLLLRGKPNERIYVMRCATACAFAGIILRTVETR